MKIEIQIATIARKLCATLLICSLCAASAAECAPRQEPVAAGSSTTSAAVSAPVSPAPVSQSAPPSPLLATGSAKQTSSSVPAAQVGAPRDGAQSGASQFSGAAAAVAGDYADQLNTFDGKNPFADDSLWQIPIHLVRELSSPASNQNGNQNNDNMAKSASEMSENDDVSAAADDYDEPIGPAAVSPNSAPTVIAASTDLKTAAGYHHQTAGHHYGHGGHHDAGHYAGHGSHGGHHGDHYGKYFQYAGVPYPYAWDFGYRRGNPYHTIERYEHGKGPHFQTKVKWSDKHGGYGVHVWDYNHDDHHSHHYGAGGHGDSHYDSHAPSHYKAAGHHYAGGHAR